jgi:hypothetical protein
MRPKFAVAVLLLAFALLGLVVLVERGMVRQHVAPVADSEVDAPSRRMLKDASPASGELTGGEVLGRRRPAASTPLLASIEPPAGADHSSESGRLAREDYVRHRIEELDRLARESDAVSLNTILSELRNLDPRIRQGALEAVIQFRDRAAIPRLQEIAESTENSEEKNAILKAIEYLKLPTLVERLSEARASASATATPSENAWSSSKH